MTLAVGVFALAGIPPFVGFMGKLTLLSAALHKRPLGPGDHRRGECRHRGLLLPVCRPRSLVPRPRQSAAIRLDWATRALCVLLIAGILALGVAPARFLDTISSSVAQLLDHRQ